jgi:hypothetical protein
MTIPIASSIDHPNCDKAGGGRDRPANPEARHRPAVSWAPDRHFGGADRAIATKVLRDAPLCRSD